MSPDHTLAVAIRVLTQLRRDHRSIAMILGVPCILLWVLQVTFRNLPGVFDRIAPMLLGTFPFVMIFLVTSITMLRERRLGTLDRMLVSPLSRADIMLGYLLAFAVVAFVQSGVALFVAVVWLDVSLQGNVFTAFLLVLLIALYGTALGLTLSAFARTEFQAVQFMPLFLLPQIFLSGLLVPVEQMPAAMRWIAAVNPLRYMFDVLHNVMGAGSMLMESENWPAMLVALLVPLAVVLVGAFTLRRESAS
jgi:ABC-2 type transport system permease protein